MLDFIQIDINQNPYICQMYEITAVPTLLFFKNGEFLNKNGKINDYYFVRNGLMIGTNCEPILKDVIWELEKN